MPARGPLLALDLGARRIGVAVSDSEGEFAFPAPALSRKSPDRDLAALRALVAERKITRIVVGLPIHLDGRVGPEAEAARTFAQQLSEATGLPVDLMDERWTTREAERALAGKPLRRAARRSRAECGGPAGTRVSRARERKSGALDSAAAAILLRTWIAREHSRAGARDAAEGSLP